MLGVNMKIKLKVCKEFKVCITVVIFALIMYSVALPNAAQAINLGSVAKKNFAEVEQGETAEFTILFWNMDASSYMLALSAERAPKKWTVIIAPEKIIMNQSKIGPPYDEGEYINSPQGNVKAVPVKVYVKVPRSAKRETYEVVIRANTYPLDANTAANINGTGVSVLLERAFRLIVKVIKPPTSFSQLGESPTDTITATVENFKKAITGMGSAIAGNPTLVLISLLSIGVWLISWKVVYKYA